MKLGSLFDGSGGFPLAATGMGKLPVPSPETMKEGLRIIQPLFVCKGTGLIVPTQQDAMVVDGKKMCVIRSTPLIVLVLPMPCRDLGTTKNLNAEAD